MSKRPKYKVDLLLDSGTFSAWNRGTYVDLDRYIQYLKENQHLVSAYVNLDVIPGKFGQARTEEDIEKSAAGSYANQQKMKDAGLKPVPVFHQGESWSWLEKMLVEGEEYIGISSAKDLWVREQRKWLDQVFSILTDRKGRPLIKTHGFGITRPAFLFRYPWYTVDSTSWSLGPGFGKILVPVYGADGKPDYGQPPIGVTMSGVQQKSPSMQKKQFESFGDHYQECVRKFLEEECGLSIGQARYGTTNRRRAFLTYYKGLSNHLRDTRFKHRLDRIVAEFDIDLSDWVAPDPWNLKIMYATSLSREWAELMNEIDANTRLLSYWELKDKPNETLEKYVKTGTVGPYKRHRPKQNWSSETYRNFRRLSLIRKVETASNEP